MCDSVFVAVPHQGPDALQRCAQTSDAPVRCYSKAKSRNRHPSNVLTLPHLIVLRPFVDIAMALPAQRRHQLRARRPRLPDALVAPAEDVSGVQGKVTPSAALTAPPRTCPQCLACLLQPRLTSDRRRPTLAEWASECPHRWHSEWSSPTSTSARTASLTDRSLSLPNFASRA